MWFEVNRGPYGPKNEVFSIVVMIALIFSFTIAIVLNYLWKDEYNKAIAIQADNSVLYSFEGKIELVKDDYVTVKVVDIGNTSSLESEIFEVSQYLIVTESEYTKDVDNFGVESNRDIRYIKDSGLEYIGEKEIDRTFSVGEHILVFLPIDTKDYIEGRLAAIAITSIV